MQAGRITGGRTLLSDGAVTYTGVMNGLGIIGGPAASVGGGNPPKPTPPSVAIDMAI